MVNTPSEGGQSISSTSYLVLAACKAAENDFAPGDADQLGLRTREIDVRRDHLNSLAGAGDDLVDRRRVGQHVIDRRLIGTNLDAEVQRKVSLRIEVQQQNLQSAAGQRRGEIGRRGRLSYAAFFD